MNIHMLRTILRRLEKAKGADRELDGDIAVELDLTPTGTLMRMSALDEGMFATGAYTSWRAPEWTGSFNKACELLESYGLRWSKSLDDHVYVQDPESGAGFRPKGATTALRLTAGVILHKIDMAERPSPAHGAGAGGIAGEAR